MAVPEVQQTFNPFPGLRPFEPEEDHLFFGRETQVDELLARLRKTRFLTVVGSSGSGKSSLVRSGLIPYLYSGYMVQAGSGWRVAIVRPGDDPIGNLANGLCDPEVLPPADSSGRVQRAILEATLRRGGQGLVEAVRQSKLPPSENLLVLVDQFEEIFRFRRSARKLSSLEESAAFTNLLLEASKQQETSIYVVLTMRSDFLGNCTEFQDLPAAINRGLYLIPRMTRDERRAAISGPVAVGGAQIAPRLILRLLNDSGDNPDQLPILQHCLMRTWDYWGGNRVGDEPLDLRHYEAVGAMQQALSLHAEEAFVELGTDTAREDAEKVFKCITEKGQDGRGIRRPSSVEEICAVTDAPQERVADVIETFRRPGRSFLVPPAGVELRPDSVVDISHESLMRVWTRLRGWVDEESQGAALYTRMAASAARYQDGQGGLWRDPELQQALGWRQSAQPTARWAQRYDPSFERAVSFLSLSREERDREIQRKERQRKRQLSFLRRIALGSALAAALVLVLAGFAWVAKQEAEQAQVTAETAREDAEVERANAVEAREEERQAKQEAEASANAALSSERKAVQEKQRADEEAEEAKAARLLAEQQKNRAELARLEEERAKERAEQNRRQAVDSQKRAERAAQEARESREVTQGLRLIELARSLAVQNTQLAQEKGAEVSALLAVQARLLNQQNGGPRRSPEIHEALRLSLERLEPGLAVVLGHRDALRALALTAAGSSIVAGDDAGVILRLRLAAGLPKARSLGRMNGARSLATSAGGELLAAGDIDGRVSLWDLRAPGAGEIVLDQPGAVVAALAFAPDGLLAAGLSRGGLRLWSREDGVSDWQHGELPERVNAIDFSRGGLLAVAGDDGMIRVWKPTAGGFELQRRLAVAEALGGSAGPADRNIRSVAFSPDGRQLSAGTFRGQILVWDLVGQGPRHRLLGHDSSVNALAFSGSGELLASASSDGTVGLWPLAGSEPVPIVLRGHASWVWSVVFGPDDRWLYSAGADGAVRRWGASGEVLATEVCARLSRKLTPQEWTDHISEDLDYVDTCSEHSGTPTDL